MDYTKDKKSCICVNPSYKQKAVMGFMYGIFGFGALLCLTTIMFYQILINENKCLFFTRFPPILEEPYSAEENQSINNYYSEVYKYDSIGSTHGCNLC